MDKFGLQIMASNTSLLTILFLVQHYICAWHLVSTVSVDPWNEMTHFYVSFALKFIRIVP